MPKDLLLNPYDFSFEMVRSALGRNGSDNKLTSLSGHCYDDSNGCIDSDVSMVPDSHDETDETLIKSDANFDIHVSPEDG